MPRGPVLPDGKGLYLEVKPNGVKAWRYRFKLAKDSTVKESMFAIGDYAIAPSGETADEAQARRKGGRFTLAEAREERTKARVMVKQGINPAHSRQLERIKRRQESATTFEAVATEWLALKDWEEVTKAHRLAMLKRVVFPKIGAFESGRLLRDIQGHGGRHETIAAFRLMWLTLCRPGEAAEARWAEFDLDAALWKIPAERMKKRKEHVTPLPAQAVAMLRALHGITGRHAHVFPGRDDRTRPMAAASFRQALNVLGWGGKYSPHATRTTGSTRLNEMGYASDWIERQLAHVEANAVRRTYNQAEHLTDRARMMQQWADMLDHWQQGGDKVEPLRQKSVA